MKLKRLDDTPINSQLTSLLNDKAGKGIPQMCIILFILTVRNDERVVT